MTIKEALERGKGPQQQSRELAAAADEHAIAAEQLCATGTSRQLDGITHALLALWIEHRLRTRA